MRSVFIYCYALTISITSVFSQAIRSTTDTKGLLLNNTSTKDTILSSAISEFRSTNKAFYPPRMPYSSINNIPNPQPGAVVYDTDGKVLRYFNGLKWESGSLPKSGKIISETYPNDTLISAGFQYAGSFSAKKTNTYPYLTNIHTISHLEAPYFSSTGGNSVGAWIQNKFIVIKFDVGGGTYDPENKTWSPIAPAPSIPTSYTIAFSGTFNDKIAFVTFESNTTSYKIYVYSVTTGMWNIYTYPTTGNSTITKVGNTIVFWKIATNSIYVFSGSSWFPLVTDNNFPPLSTIVKTLAFNNNLIILWNDAGIVKGKIINVEISSVYIPPYTPLYFAPQWVSLNSSNSPNAISDQTFKMLNNKLVIWGGYNGVTYVNTGSIYDFQSNVWTTMNPAGSPTGIGQFDLYIDEYQGKIVVFGGVNGGLMGQTDPVGGLYDISTQSWSIFNTNNKPWTGYSPTIFVHNNNLYFKGAYNTFDNPNPPRYNTSSGRYNLISNEWEQTSNVRFGTAYHYKIWTGQYFISWFGSLAGTYGNYNIYARGGFIESLESFGVTKTYYLYNKP